MIEKNLTIGTLFFTLNKNDLELFVNMDNKFYEKGCRKLKERTFVFSIEV